jgi:hypothetical protein
MAKWSPLPFAGGSYADDSRPWSHQDTVNYLPVKAEKAGTRSPMLLRGVPGGRAFAGVGIGPHRVGGGRDVEGKMFVVSGTGLYQVTPAGVSTLLGTIPGTGAVSMTHNQVAGGNQLVIATGSSGYVYDTSNGTLTQITTAAFSGFVQVDYLNQYIIGVEPQRHKWQHSQLNDALSYNSLDSYEGEAFPDRLVGIVNSHGQVLALSERSGEFFDNIVDPSSISVTAFQKSQGTVMERGCAAAQTIAKIDNSVLFCGNDGVVYRVDGYTPVRVSTHAIEQALARADLSRAFAFFYEDRGHAIYYITCPDGYTWGFDVSTQEWHRRQSYGLTRWRVNTLFKSNGKWYAGDYTSNVLYQLEWDYMLEGCDVLERTRVFQVMHAEQNRISIDALELVVDTGSEESIQHAAATLSGDLPNGAVGQIVSYQYSITRAYPGQSVTVSLASGILPAGLTLSASGLLSGTLTTAGTYSWTVRVTDECATAAYLPDVAAIGTDVWFASTKNGSFNYATMGSFSPGWSTPVLSGVYGYAYTDSSGLWVSQASGQNRAVSTDAGATWAAVNTVGVSAGGGRMAFAGGYQFVCGGNSTLFRRTNGAWTNPSASTLARAGAIVIQNGKLVTVLNIFSSASSDYGATWTQGGTFYASGATGTPVLASNGTRVVVLYTEGLTGGYNTRIKYSDDDGATWSASAYAFPSPGSANLAAEVIWTGAVWIASTITGQIATSPDAVTWTLSASVLSGTIWQFAAGTSAGVRKIMAACDGFIYSSVDAGSTWQSVALPTSHIGAVGIVWLYP